MLLEWQLKSCPAGSKTPTLYHLQQVKKVTGKTPSVLAQYEASSIPEELRYVYNLYLDFYNGDSFRYSEFYAWQQYLGVKLSFLESQLIRQICLERQAFDIKRQQAEIEHAKHMNKKR